MHSLFLSALTLVTIVLLLFFSVMFASIIKNAKAQENTTNIIPPTPANDNSTTTNFLTYTNSIYGIKIQYPPYWIKEEFQNQSSGRIVELISPRGTAGLQISVGQPARQNMSLEQLSNATINALFRPSLDNFSLIDSNSTTLAGFPAHEIVYTATLPASGVKMKAMQFWTIKDGKGFIITAITAPSDFSFYLPTLHEMINSFAFIPTVTTPTGVITGLLLYIVGLLLYIAQNYYTELLFVTVVLFPVVRYAIKRRKKSRIPRRYFSEGAPF